MKIPCGCNHGIMNQLNSPGNGMYRAIFASNMIDDDQADSSRAQIITKYV